MAGGILARLFGRTETPAPVEHRYGIGPGWGDFLPRFGAPAGVLAGPSDAAGNARLAENLGVVVACANAIGSALGSLPPLVFRDTTAGREEVRSHPVARLVRRPNPAQTWPDWIDWTIAQVLLHGNALSVIELDGAGRPVALVPVPWPAVAVLRLPGRRLAYEVPQEGGGVRRYLADEVFHLRDRSDDGLIGRSRISRAPEVIGNGASLQDVSSSLWRNGLLPSGVMSAPEYLDDDQRTRADSMLDRFKGARNAGKVPLLEGGWTFQATSISPEDAGVLASRRFTVEEICRLFQVPPPIVQDYTHNTFTNAAQASLWFAQLTLAPWAKRIEAEFSRSVFGSASSDCSLEIDLSGLMRGDYEARWRAHEIAVRNGILDANEVRWIEGWNPRQAASGAG